MNLPPLLCVRTEATMGFTGTVTRSRAGSHPLCRCAALRVTFDLRRVFALQKAGRETAAPVPHPIRTP